MVLYRKNQDFMKNNSFLILILMSILPLLASGQFVSIEGKTNVTDALIRLFTYDEMLTCEQTKVAEAQSDKNGNFKLEANIAEITPAQIAINLTRVDIVLCPGGTYNLEITVPNRNIGSYFEQEMPLMKINSADDGGFYSQFVATQYFIDDFIHENFNSIYRGRKTFLMDTLDNQLIRNFGVIENKYIKDLIKYRKASLLMSVNAKKTMSEYFDNQEVMYMQRAYMDALSDLRNTIGSDDDFLSRNWQIAELIMMMNLNRSFYANAMNQSQILNSLAKIEKSSESRKNRKVASNIIKQLKELAYDSDAPAFSLKNKQGEMIQIADYQNDMVLIQFVDGITPLIENEFASLNSLHEQWRDTIQIVTIVTKESFDDYTQLFDKQGYDWQLLNLGDNILLLEAYHVRICPAYIILKRNNRIGMAPAPSPFHYLDVQVRRISKYL